MSFAASAARKHVGPCWPVSPPLAARAERLPDLAAERMTAERKHDGWRILAHRTATGAVLQTRSGRWLPGPAADRLAADLAERLPPGTVLDGELVDADSLTRPQPTARHRRLAMIVFDIPSLAGQSLAAEPYTTRRRSLQALAELAAIDLADATTCQTTAAAWLADAAHDPRYDGIMAKPAGSPYCPGRGHWRKIKPHYARPCPIGPPVST